MSSIFYTERGHRGCFFCLFAAFKRGTKKVSVFGHPGGHFPREGAGGGPKAGTRTVTQTRDPKAPKKSGRGGETNTQNRGGPLVRSTSTSSTSRSGNCPFLSPQLALHPTTHMRHAVSDLCTRGSMHQNSAAAPRKMLALSSTCENKGAAPAVSFILLTHSMVST